MESETRLISIVTPAFNEADSLLLLCERIKAVLDRLPLTWEWVIVDDHSSDATFAVISCLAAEDARVRGIRLARNSGAHAALTCALHAARGECAIALAADLQDPPEAIPRLLDEWQAGNKVVWAARSQRPGESTRRVWAARTYYWSMRHVVGLKQIPPTGADFFLIDQDVLEAFRRFRESNVSILALIAWMGFRQTYISYAKQPRIKGESGWTLKKKLELFVDSVTGFSCVPIRLMSYLGAAVALVGFVYAIFLVVAASIESPVQGWSTLLAIVLILGGIQMSMMGIIGEYLWRALNESRRRPQYIIEDETGQRRAESE
jgi:polyisoprenyl-phosphate glycosyltransferase